MTAYADPADLVPHAMVAAAAAQFSSEDKLAAIAAVCDEFDAELNRRYTLPLTAWGVDLRRNVAIVAGYELLSGVGFDSADEGSQAQKRAAAARAWIKRVGDGTLDPPGIVDSTPDVAEDGVIVYSSARRGW